MNVPFSVNYYNSLQQIFSKKIDEPTGLYIDMFNILLIWRQKKKKIGDEQNAIKFFFILYIAFKLL